MDHFNRRKTPKLSDNKNGKTPACVFVCQDGAQYNAPVVFDNLVGEGTHNPRHAAAIFPDVMRWACR